MALVQKELKGCHLQLQKKEEELEAKIVQLEQEAVSRKRAKVFFCLSTNLKFTQI